MSNGMLDLVAARLLTTKHKKKFPKSDYTKLQSLFRSAIKAFTETEETLDEIRRTKYCICVSHSSGEKLI